MPDTSIPIAPQTALIIRHIGTTSVDTAPSHTTLQTSARLNQSDKHTPYGVWRFAKTDFEMGTCALSQAVLATKSKMQMCRMCRVGVGFLVFFGLFAKIT